MYRPFCKQFFYYGEKVIHRRGQMNELFPNKKLTNKIIYVQGLGGNKDFSTLASTNIMDLNCLEAGSQGLPLYYYEKLNSTQKGLFDESINDLDFTQRCAISDFILDLAKINYGKTVTKEDIFFYVYGFLHCNEYKTYFSSDLKKISPKIPLVEDVNDFWAFSKAGRNLFELHTNYESVNSIESVVITGVDSQYYIVDKMRFPKKDQKDTIIYNNKITISNIPIKAYNYIVNGKSAIEWIMERYQISTNKENGIINNPNDWAAEVGNPRYILDLLLSIINVSVQTVDIVNSLPKVNFT